MPLPRDGAEWVPKGWEKIYDLYAEHSAWYSGDPNQIANVYASQLWSPTPKGRHWAREVGEERRTMLHVPIAGDIAGISADLLFAEAPTITIPEAEGDTLDGSAGGRNSAAIKTQERLNEIVEMGDVHSKLIEAAETCAALGGIFLKFNWDAEFEEFPVLSVVQADSAIPEFQWGILKAVTFHRIVRDDDNAVYRHLERHEYGKIYNGLYKGDRDRLGFMIGLDALPETAGLDPEIDLPIDDLAVRYVPNMRPNRKFRGSAIGQSDYSGIEGLMDSLDETYTSWMRDVRLGQSRLIVPESWLDRDPSSGAAKFDVDNEIFTTLDIDPISAQGVGITASQFEIRTEQHLNTCLELMNRIVSSAGYSPQTFGLAIEGRAESGTALGIRERRSYMTKNKKERYFKIAIEEILEMMLVIDKEVFNSGIEIFRPQIEFSDGATQDINSIAETVEIIGRAQAATIKTKVRMLHPDWTMEQVEEEVQGILDETGIGTIPADAPPFGEEEEIEIPEGDNPEEE